MKPSPTHTEPLTVVMRVRPLNSKEIKAGSKSIVHPVDDKLVVLMDPHDDIDDILRANRSREKHYIFDHTFSSEATQEEVYCAVVQEKGIIESVLSGYNCTVFAYGATGTGKTHTMLGTQDEPGIMVHTLNNLFLRMERTKDEMEYQVSMGYLEIYNECVRDLLCPDSGSLELREDSSGSITVSNLLDISASSTDVVLGMLRMGNTNRTSEPTVANRTSSRSHAILKVNVEQRSRTSNVTQEVRCGSLYMVDLAGSERAAVTQNRGKRMIEGAHINRSLLALANCINALGSNNSNYVNYRDSKLTRILKEALGGNCKTVMIAHASPASSSYEDTRNTMLYADRSKKIKNRARQNVVDVNHHVTQYLHIIDDLQYQNVRLRTQLLEERAAGEEGSEVRDMCERLKALAQEQRELRHRLLDVECQLLRNGVQRQKHSACIKAWEDRRDSLGEGPGLGHNTVFSPPLFTPTTKHTEPGHPKTIETDAGTEDLPSTSDHTCSPHRKPHPISLQQAGHVATTCSDPVSRKGASQEQPLSPLVPMEDYITGEVGTGAGGCVMYKVDNKPREFTKVAVATRRELVQSVSPDSGAEMMSVTAAAEGEGEGPEMEPMEVSTAREAVAELGAAKQRLEAEHKRVQRMLRENRAGVAEIRERLSESSGDLLPVKKDLVDLLLHTSDLEASQAEHSLSSLLMSVHLSHHTSLLDQLLQHSAALLGALGRAHKAKTAGMVAAEEGEEEEEGAAEGGVGITSHDELIQQYQELADRQKKLAAEVAKVKGLPLAGEKMEIPSISRFSAKLYTAMTGSKSNLLVAEGLSDDGQPSFVFSRVDQSSSDLHLPSIASPRHSLSSKSTAKDSLTLPPINSLKKPALEAEQRAFPVPLKKSELTQILEAAKKSRDDKIAAALAMGRAKRPQKRATTSKLAAAFVSPRASYAGNRSKYPVLPQTVVFQGERSGVSRSSAQGETTEIIDLETSDAASLATSASPDKSVVPLESFQGQNTRSQPHLTSSPSKKSTLRPKVQDVPESFQGQNTRSQPHLTTLPLKKATQTSKPTRHHRLRRSRSHARIVGDLGQGEPTAGLGEKPISVSMEDVSGETGSKGEVLGEEGGEEKETVAETKGTSTSRPIVKKPTFVKQNLKHSGMKAQTHSVYAARPYVIPVARRILQQAKSPRHQAPPKSGVTKSKRVAPLGQYPRGKKKLHPLASRRQELPMPRVKPGAQFPFPSPYLSSPTKQGDKTGSIGVSKTSSVRKPASKND